MVRIRTYCFTVKLNVAVNACNDIILGVPFFQQTRMHLDYGANGCTVTFNNGVVCKDKVVIPPRQSKHVTVMSKAPVIQPGVILLSTRLSPTVKKQLLVHDMLKSTEPLIGHGKIKLAPYIKSCAQDDLMITRK